MGCLGCNLANKREPVFMVFEDNYVCCFMDHDPFNDGHVLILPKSHARYLYDIDEKTANSVMKASKLISQAIEKAFNPDGITICQHGGAFDELTHFHMHVVPVYKGQSFADFYLDKPINRVDKNNLMKMKRKLIQAINN